MGNIIKENVKGWMIKVDPRWHFCYFMNKVYSLNYIFKTTREKIILHTIEYKPCYEI